MSFDIATPADWRRSSVSKYCHVQLGKMLQSDPSGDEDELLPYLRAISISKSGVDLSHQFTMWIKPREKEKFRLQLNDVLVSEGGDAGRTAHFDADGEYYFQNAINRVRPLDGDQIASRYLFYWFTFLKLAGYVDLICNVATIAHFTAEKVRAAPLAFPPLETQQRIAAFLDEKTAQIDGLIARKQALLERLAEKRQAIITQAVTKGLNPAAPMKDSGIDWLGTIPAHWEVARLDRLNDYRRPIRYGIVLPGPHFEGGVPIIKGGDVRPERLKRHLLNCTDPEIDAANPKARVRAGDLVYTIRGSFGDVEIVTEELAGCNLTQDTARISPIDGIDRNWLLMALKSSVVRGNLAAGSLGATIKGINIFDLRRALLPTPPLTEQRAIADELTLQTVYLDDIQQRIETSTSLLSDYRAALITAAVTGQIEGLR